jgi:hypothetical protein
MCQRKGQRDGWKRGAVTLADLGDAPSLLHELPCRLLVVVLCARRGRGAREQPAVEHAGGDDPDAALFADWKQIVERGLLEERVTAGEHEQVHVVWRAKSASIAVWFMPAPIADSIPCPRNSSRAG